MTSETLGSVYRYHPTEAILELRFRGSDSAELDLDVVVVHDNPVRRDTGGSRSAGGGAGSEVKPGAMPRTGHRRRICFPFGQGPPLVRAGIAYGIVATFDVEQCHLLSADLDRNTLTRPNFFLISDCVEFAHVVIAFLDRLRPLTRLVSGSSISLRMMGKSDLKYPSRQVPQMCPRRPVRSSWGTGRTLIRSSPWSLDPFPSLHRRSSQTRCRRFQSRPHSSISPPGP
jgi:hypothetical protein